MRALSLPRVTTVTEGIAVTRCGFTLRQYAAGGSFWLLTECCKLPASYSAAERGTACEGCLTPVPQGFATGPLNVRTAAATLRALGCRTPLECAAEATWEIELINRSLTMTRI